MKLEIDTTNKCIKILEQVTIGELMYFLDASMPNGEWKEYKIEPYINYSPIPIWTEPYYYPWPFGSTPSITYTT